MRAWLVFALLFLAALGAMPSSLAAAPPDAGPVAMDRIPSVQWRFYGEMGARLKGNLEAWTLRAPGANPGLLEMFQRRDRAWPYADLVPWAGEFAGKFLTAAVLNRRLHEDPRQDELIQDFVTALAESQGDDGYLGPFRADDHWRGHWDLWGHYHLILGLLLWYEDTGEFTALHTAQKAADGICALYGPGGKRPIEAATPETNFGLLHGLGLLYRHTGEARYKDLMLRIVEDMPAAGDWLNQGAAGTPYHAMPRNGVRWESLHAVQGFFELYRITGEEQYKTAVVNLWRSLRDTDRHPSGAFSTGEVARGTVHSAGAIETCCSIAWLALSVDMLKLTGDPTVADELELTTWNQVLAAQHPSGSWCTYDTPLNGIRAPSYHQINFQYRTGTPELNCCSVNGPRGHGVLRDWAVMQDDTGVFLNYYGAGSVFLKQPDGRGFTITQETAYPTEGKIVLRIVPMQEDGNLELRLRIPAWSRNTTAQIAGEAMSLRPSPGSYLKLGRDWRKETTITLTLDMQPRHWTGEAPAYADRAAFYRGPLLLAFDPYFNPQEIGAFGAIDAAKFDPQPVIPELSRRPGVYPPLGLWSVKTAEGGTVTLCDFASAGTHGTAYEAWLPAVNTTPAPTRLVFPEEGAAGPADAAIRFVWQAGRTADRYVLLIARDAAFEDIALRLDQLQTPEVTVAPGTLATGTYFWKVQTAADPDPIDNRDGARRFSLGTGETGPVLTMGPDGLVLSASLDGVAEPELGQLQGVEGAAAAADRKANPNGALAFDGVWGQARYALPLPPAGAFAFAAWVYPEQLDKPGVQHLCSAWHTGMDDPLRVTLDGGKLHARIEAGTMYSTPGVPLPQDAWSHVAAVKEGGQLRLYLNGEKVAETGVPVHIPSASRLLALGGNPQYRGASEGFTGRIDDARFYLRALTESDIAALAAE